MVKHSKTIMHVSNLAWDILKTVKKDTLQILERNSKKFKTRVIHNDDSLTIQWDSSKKDNDCEIRMCAEVLKCYCYVIRDKELGEIYLDQNNSDTQKWCDEIDQIIQMQCCVYIPEQNRVLVYCNTYDDLQKVKHHFRVKEGKIRPTRRKSSRRNEVDIQLIAGSSHVNNESSIPYTPGASSHTNNESPVSSKLLETSKGFFTAFKWTEKAKKTMETYKDK